MNILVDKQRLIDLVEAEEKLTIANKALEEKLESLRSKIRLLRRRDAARQRNIAKHF